MQPGEPSSPGAIDDVDTPAATVEQDAEPEELPVTEFGGNQLLGPARIDSRGGS